MPSDVIVPTNYKEALTSIILYSSAVKAYKIPDLANPDKWPGGIAEFQKLEEAWKGTTAKLRSWALTCLAGVIEMPKTLMSIGDLKVLPGLRFAVNLSEILIKNPGHEETKEDLRAKLKTLSAYFKQYAEETSQLVAKLQDHATVFDTDAQLMNKIAANALNAAGNQRVAIEKLNHAIENLNSEIKSAIATIVVGGGITVIGIVMGVAAVALAPLTGGLSLTLLIPAAMITAGGGYIIFLNVQKIQEANSKIELFNRQINSLGADITLVNVMSTTLRGFADQVNGLKENLDTVVKPWKETHDYLQTIEHEFVDIQTSDDWKKVNSELKETVIGWENLIGAMKKLEIDPKVVPNSELKFGMDETTIRKELESHPQQNLIQYLRAS
jgi:hypothetical protein